MCIILPLPYSLLCNNMKNILIQLLNPAVGINTIFQNKLKYLIQSLTPDVRLTVPHKIVSRGLAGYTLIIETYIYIYMYKYMVFHHKALPTCIWGHWLCLSIWYSRSITCSCVAKIARRYTFAAWNFPPFSLSMVLHHKALPTCIWGHCLCPSIWYSRSITCSCVAKTARRYTFAACPDQHKCASFSYFHNDSEQGSEGCS